MIPSQEALSTRDALLEAALRVVAKEGVRGVTHRKVAAEAGVSLSATSYHLSSIESLIHESFIRFVDSMLERLTPRLLKSDTPDEMADALIFSLDTILEDQDNVILMYELYAQGARDPEYRKLINRWSDVVRKAIEMNFPPPEAALSDMMLEGLVFECFLNPGSLNNDVIRGIFKATINGETGNLSDLMTNLKTAKTSRWQ